MIKKFRSSLFLKLLLIFLAGMAVFAWAMRYSHDKLIRDAHFPKIQQTAVNLSNYILESVGVVPDTIMARIMADSLGVKLRYRSDALEWQSHELIPEFGDPDIPVYPLDQNIRAGFDRGLFVITSTESGQFMVVIQDKQDGVFYAAEKMIIVNTGSFVIIILLMFIAIRQLLMPIRMLNKGVQALSEGNIEFDIKSKRQDELGKLIQSFSSMVDRIRVMLESRERLLLDVSHELRSPLTRVKLSLEMMRSCPERAEIAADIHEMEIMITEILESERLSSPHDHLNMETVGIVELVDDLIQELGTVPPGIQKGVIPAVSLKGDAKRLRILLSNLISNGIKYSKDNSKPVSISGSIKDDRLQLVIRNYGVTIPEQELPLIFEPFYRVDKSRTKSTGGYGLGLSLAKRIAEAHEGNLTITSGIEEGVKATLVLPVA